MSGRTCAKCRLHGKRELLRGHKRICPYASCSCALCASHDHTLAYKSNLRETQKDKGFLWRQTQPARKPSSVKTATTTSTSTAKDTAFPELVQSAEPHESASLVALQLASFEDAKKISERTLPKAEQRKSKYRNPKAFFPLSS